MTAALHVPGCYACEHNAAAIDPRVGGSPERVHLTQHWRLALAFDSSLPGWLVLVPRRHVEGLHELTADEAEGMGTLLRSASAALVEVTGCERTYVILFAEAEGFAHLHLHVVPRHADLPATHRGPAVFAYLGASPEDRVPEAETDALAAQLRRALGRVSP